jgi:hypothetical protein
MIDREAVTMQRFLNPLRILRLLLAAIFLMGLGAGMQVTPVHGFVVGEDNGTPDDPSDDLLGASRWSNVPGSLVEQGIRGLGGGLEYAIAPDFCDRLLPKFVDSPPPTCDQLRQAIRHAADTWAQANPHIRFVDVSDRIAPMLPPPDVQDPWRGFGAEIDFFALSPEEYPKVKDYGAYTSWFYLYTDPMGTNGRILPGNTLTSADIVFNTQACYYLDPALSGSGCNHFESLVLHELGHTFALDHPNEFQDRNFDNDDDPTNPIVVSNCMKPWEGFHLSPHFHPQAVMNSSLGKPEPVRSGLSPDDVGALNFLYPTCPPSAPAVKKQPAPAAKPAKKHHPPEALQPDTVKSRWLTGPEIPTPPKPSAQHWPHPLTGPDTNCLL